MIQFRDCAISGKEGLFAGLVSRHRLSKCSAGDQVLVSNNYHKKDT